MAKKKLNLEEQIRQAIKSSGISVYRLAKDSRISQPALCRFLNGHRGMTLSTASKLVETLGLELAPKQKKR